MFEFILAITLLLITPGPGALTTAGVGSAYGYPTGLRFIVGLFIGTNLVALAVVSGLAASLESLPWLRLTLLIISAAYLAWIIHEDARFSLAPFAHRGFRSLGNTVCIPLARKIPCELSVHRDNRTFHE